MIMQQFMLGLMKLLYYQFMNPEYILYAWRQHLDKGYKISVACNISYAAYLLAQLYAYIQYLNLYIESQTALLVC